MADENSGQITDAFYEANDIEPPDSSSNDTSTTGEVSDAFYEANDIEPPSDGESSDSGGILDPVTDAAEDVEETVSDTESDTGGTDGDTGSDDSSGIVDPIADVGEQVEETVSETGGDDGQAPTPEPEPDPPDVSTPPGVPDDIGEPQPGPDQEPSPTPEPEPTDTDTGTETETETPQGVPPDPEEGPGPDVQLPGGDQPTTTQPDGTQTDTTPTNDSRTSGPATDGTTDGSQTGQQQDGFNIVAPSNENARIGGSFQGDIPDDIRSEIQRGIAEDRQLFTVRQDGETLAVSATDREAVSNLLGENVETNIANRTPFAEEDVRVTNSGVQLTDQGEQTQRQLQREQFAERATEQIPGRFQADDVVLGQEGPTLDLQAQREAIAAREGVDVSDVTFTDGSFRLEEPPTTTLTTQELQDAQVEGQDPVDIAAEELDVAPENVRVEQTEEGLQATVGTPQVVSLDTDTTQIDGPTLPEGTRLPSDIEGQVTDAPTASQVQFGEQTAPENIVDSITGLSTTGGDFLRERVTTPAAEITGDVVGAAETTATVAPDLVPVGGGDMDFDAATDEIETDVRDIVRGEEQEVGDTTALESGTENLTRGVLETGPMVVEAPETVRNLGELGYEGVTFTAESIQEEGAVEGTQESLEAGAETGGAFVQRTVQQAQEQPLFTAGTLVGTAVGVGAASRVSSGLGRGVTYAIQPGEELLTGGLTRLAPGVASRIPGGQIDPENIALAGTARAVQGARRAPSRIRSIDAPVSFERPTIENAPRVETFQGETAPRLGFDVDRGSVEFDTNIRETISEVRAGERDIPAPETPFSAERTLTPEGVETDVEPTAARGPESFVESVRESRAADVAGDIRRRAGREIQRLREPRPDYSPEVDLGDTDAVFVQDFRGEVETEQDTGPETQAGPDTVTETETDVGGGQRQIMQQDVRQFAGFEAETEAERAPRGVGQEFDTTFRGTEIFERQQTGPTEPTETTPTDLLGFEQGQDVGQDPTVEPVETPTLDGILGPELGTRPETEVEPRTRFGPEIETETETETETESEFEQELELEQEAEREAETEAEFEAEGETEGEPFWPEFGTDGDDGRGPFGGAAEGVITSFVNPLTGEVIETDPDASNNPFGL